MPTTDEELRAIRERLDREEAERKKLLDELRERTADATTPTQRMAAGFAANDKAVEDSGAETRKELRAARLRAQEGGTDAN